MRNLIGLLVVALVLLGVAYFGGFLEPGDVENEATPGAGVEQPVAGTDVPPEATTATEDSPDFDVEAGGDTSDSGQDNGGTPAL